jgi:histidine triad (HIT) family protein
MEGCLFCSIAAGTTPGAFVLDEPEVVAFLDVRPVFVGHVLVVPRSHFETMADLPGQLIPVVFGAVQRVSAAVVGALEADGTFLGVNNRVSQSVPHLHVHVVPRRFKDGLRGFFWPRTRYESDAALQETAAAIRSALG